MSVQDYEKARVIVTGASGFIGRWVARVLSSRGAKTYLIVRDPAAAEAVFSRFDAHGEIVKADLRDRDLVRNIFAKIRPHIIFNLAGYGIDHKEREEKTACEINSNLAAFIAQAALDHSSIWPGQTMVHAGTVMEYGHIGGNLDEESKPEPTTLYGKSKLLGTQNLTRFCLQTGLKGVTARLFAVYGPGEQPGRLLPSLLKIAENGRALEMTAGLHKRDFVYVEDVAEGLLRLGTAQARPGDVVNLATGRSTSIRRFVEIASNVLRIDDSRLIFGALPTAAEELTHDPVTVAKLKSLTGWIPHTDISEGIRKTLSFEKQAAGRR